MEYREVQAIARETIAKLRKEVHSGMSLEEVRNCCEAWMFEMGADSFWYYDVGAFVFSGEETSFSASGRTYETPKRILQEDDILTIDLSPQRRGVWGDYARTIILEKGKAVEEIGEIRNQEWKQGLLMEEKLHQELLNVAHPEMTFEQLYLHMNALIAHNGFVNLDFNGNLGHSIEKRREDRIYIEMGNRRCLKDAAMFTFEPHIAREGLSWGYKKENIYCFVNDRLEEV